MPDTEPQHALWRNANPLVLASSSRARRDLLASSGIPLKISPANIDERALEASLHARGASAKDIAGQLAYAKAEHVASSHPGNIVLGADQILVCDGVCFSKPASRLALQDQLNRLSGRVHHLISAASLWRDGRELMSCDQSAEMAMRRLSPAFISTYTERGGDALLSSVGGYQIEGLGIQLFDAIRGEHPVILGLPLLPVLQFLREEGSLLA